VNKLLMMDRWTVRNM